MPDIGRKERRKIIKMGNYKIILLHYKESNFTLACPIFLGFLFNCWKIKNLPYKRSTFPESLSLLTVYIAKPKGLA